MNHFHVFDDILRMLSYSHGAVVLAVQHVQLPVSGIQYDFLSLTLITQECVSSQLLAMSHQCCSQKEK